MDRNQQFSILDVDWFRPANAPSNLRIHNIRIYQTRSLTKVIMRNEAQKKYGPRLPTASVPPGGDNGDDSSGYAHRRALLDAERKREEEEAARSRILH
jgi:hypothetical protein